LTVDLISCCISVRPAVWASLAMFDTLLGLV
jgi:hypothetical protein